MKKRLAGWMATAVLSFYGLFAAATSASAFTLVTTNENVGLMDKFLGAKDLSNSDSKAELDWIESILLIDNVVLVENYDTPENDILWTQTNEDANTFALKLLKSPEYFMIKTGNNKAGENNHFLFQNLLGLDWAVVNLSASFGEGYTIKNVGKFSHLNEYDAGTTSVPEPGTLMLLGAGLLGFAVYGKRRMNKKE